jgi:hypothetical protein
LLAHWQNAGATERRPVTIVQSVTRRFRPPFLLSRHVVA